MKKLITSLQQQKQFRLKSQGQSMKPLLQSDDALYFKETTFLRIRINDLVVIDKDKKIFAHRVIYKTKNFLVTKGDNNPQSDGKINPGKIYVDRDGRQETYACT